MRGFRSVLLLAVGFILGLIQFLSLAGCAAKAPANGPSALNIAQFTLPQGAVNVPYQEGLLATGGVQPYTWSISSGALPAGLSLTTDGAISGTPSADPSQYSATGCALTNNSFPITCNFAAQVVDSQTPLHAMATMGLSIIINADLSLTPMSLGTGVVGAAFNITFEAANGVAPYSYACVTANCADLPPGLTLTTVASMNGMANPATITGTPTTAGVFSFTIQATDSIGETATAVYTITITGTLQGPYAVSFNGFDASQPPGSQAFYLLAQLVAANDVNGSGTITGVIDQTGASPTPSGGTTVMTGTGSYTFPSGSNFGTISFTRADNNATYQFNVALSSTNDSKLILVDANNQKWGSGLLKAQTTTSLPGGASYTFGSFGTDSGGNRFAGAGAFALSTQLAVTGGAEDTNDNGTASGEQCITTGTFSTPDPNTGRGTVTLMTAPLSGGTCGSTPTTSSYVYYVASATELLALETDSGGPVTLVDILQQESAGISGGFLLCKAGSNCQSVLQLDGIAGGSSPVPEVELGVASFSSCTGSPCAGTFMRSDSLPPYYVDQSIAGTLTSITYSGGTYSIDATCGPMFPAPCGRVTVSLTGASTQPVWYLVTIGQAFVVGNDSDVLQGELQPQSPPTQGFALSSFVGSYLGGTLTPVLSSVLNEIDVASTPPPGGIWAQNYQISGAAGSQTGLSFMGTYNIDMVNPAGQCDPTTGANCLGSAFGRFAICAPNTTQYCTGNSQFTFDPNNPPLSIVYIAGGGAIGATGGKSGLVGLSTGVAQSNGTATLDTNPRLSSYGR